MWYLKQGLPALTLFPSTFKWLGVVLMIIGFSLDLTALMQFIRKHTTLNPLSPDKASTIVVSGLYHYTRNPMYLGMLVALCGWGIYLGNLASLLCLPAFVWVLTRMQINAEERLLSKKFGKPYTDYLKQVRRWL